MKIRVYYKDTDAGAIVYHANYISFCEMARSEFFFENRVKAFGENELFVVTKLEAKYHKPSYLGDILEIKTSLKELKKTNMTLHQEIYRVEDESGASLNELAFSTDIQVAFLKERKLSKIPQNIVELLSR